MNNDTATLMQNTFGSASEVWTGEPSLPTPAPKPQTNQRQIKTKRLTIDIPADLHIRVKLAAVSQGATLGDLIRDMLEKRFSAKR